MSAEKKLTREQNIALEYDRHILVTANAGSGKTSVLIERIAKILLDDKMNVEPKEIVAITFTKKAAQEMKSRLAHKISYELKNASNNAKYERLKRLREKIDTIRISTIHSFCSSLLREFPIEAGVAPNFSEIDEADSKQIIENSIDTVLSEILYDENNLESNMLKKILVKYDLEFVKNILKDLNINRELFNSSSKKYESLDAEEYALEIINHRREQIHKKIEDCFLSIYNLDVKTAFDTKYNELKGTAPKQKVLQAAEEYHKYEALLFNSYKGLLKERNYEELRKRYINLRGVKISSSLAINIAAKLEGIDIKLADEYLKDNFLSDRESIGENAKYELVETINEIKYLHKMTESVIEYIEEYKAEIPAITFDDMMILADRLLENEDAALLVREDIKFLFVDEFQDTNQLQYDIIKKIVPDLDSNRIEEQSPNLFIVGDAKQSIYAFRGADVRVFKQAEKDIIARNISKNTSRKDDSYSTDEINGKILFSESFRLAPSLVSFVNSISSTTFNANQTEYDVQYDSLQYAKDKNVIESINQVKGDYFQGSVTLLLNLENRNSNFVAIDDENFEENIDNSVNISDEAALVAKYIQDLITKKTLKIETGNNELRDATYSDIAILARKSSKFNILAGELAQLSIPYQLQSSKAFFEQQEILDLVSLLKFIFNTNNDLALASVLKSYLFGISDEDLFLVFKDKNKSLSLWEDLISRYATFDAKVQFCIEELGRLIQFQYNSYSNALVKIVENSALYANMSNSANYEKILANINKFITIAQKVEKKAKSNLSDFLNEIDVLSEESSEGSAKLNTSDNAVKVMTYHASKGLEFPIVILFDSNYREQSKAESYYISEKYGLVMKSKVVDDKYNVLKLKNNALYSLIQEEMKQQEEAENVRMLYVAMTRAKNHLIVSASNVLKADDKKNPNSVLSAFSGMMKIIELGLKSMEFPLDLDSLVNSESHRVTTKINLPSKISKTYAYDINIITNKDPDESDGRLQLGASYEELLDSYLEHHHKFNIMLEAPKIENNYEILSATQLMNFSKDDDKYMSKYVYNIVEYKEEKGYKTTKYDEYNQENKLSANVKGTLLHSIMEIIDMWAKLDSSTRRSFLVKKIIQFAYSDDVIINEDKAEEIANECELILQNKTIQTSIDDLINAEKEITYNLIVNSDDMLVGTLDALIEKSESSVEIWDWKTNSISEAKLEETALSYQFQMQYYAYLVFKENEDIQDIKCRLYFSHILIKNPQSENWIHEYTFSREYFAELENIILEKILSLKKAM